MDIFGLVSSLAAVAAIFYLLLTILGGVSKIAALVAELALALIMAAKAEAVATLPWLANDLYVITDI